MYRTLTQDQKDEISYFIAVRSFIMKTTKTGTPDLKEINERISKMLEEAVLSDEVLVLTETTVSDSFDLLNEENIAKLRAMPQKNIATNILMRVMREKLEQVKKTNLAISRSFSERFEKIVERYNSRIDDEDVEEVLEELIRFKDELVEAIEQGKHLGLSHEEKAFYDVLGADPDIRKLMEDQKLIAIAKDLVETVRKHRTHDWNKKYKPKQECVIYKEVLRKHGYPPKEPKQLKMFSNKQNFKRKGFNV